MSRTYRKSSLTEEQSEITFVHNRVHRLEVRPYPRFVKRKKPKEVYQQELAEATLQAENEYNDKLKVAKLDETGKPYVGYKVLDYTLFKNYIYPPRVYVTRFIYEEKVFDKDAEVEETKKEYRSFMRDGVLSETGRKTGFKEFCTVKLRRKNKVFCHKVLKDTWDNECYPEPHETDYARWNFW